MPMVINGIGTWQYGKRNIYRCVGQCEFCNNVTNLESYDITEYFVVVFVPIIPLGSKRILSNCAACSRHRYLSLKQWEALKTKSVTDILEKLTQDPRNTELICEALGNSIAFQDVKLLDKLVQLTADMQADAKVQTTLGHAYSYFGRHEEANQAYMNALRMEDSNAVRECLAESFLRQKDAGHAIPLVRHILTERKAESLWLVQATILTSQGQGLHREALDLINERDAAFPALVEDKECQKQRRISTMNLETGKKIRVGEVLSADANKSEEGSTFKHRLARWAFPSIILAAFLLYLSIALYSGQSRTIYVVNGTSRNYDVTINGETVTLPAMRATKHRVTEGQVVIETKSPGLDFEPTNTEFRTGFWGRPFNNEVFVFNPDRLAPIIVESTTYAAANPPMNPPGVFHMGREFYRLPSADYVFDPFPPTISVKGNNTITKTRIGVEPVDSANMRLMVIELANLSEAEKLTYLKRLAKTQSNDVMILGVLGQRLPQKELLEFLKSGLSMRPIAVNWHRMYQTTMEKANPAHDLVSEYKALAAEVHSADSQYLLGRVSEDKQSQELYLKAATMNPPSAYAMQGLGFIALSVGEFKESAAWMEKAVSANPMEVMFQTNFIKALVANREFERVVAIPDGPNAELFDFEKYRAAVLSGNKQLLSSESARMVQKYQSQSMTLKPHERAKYIEGGRNTLELFKAMAEGDVKGYLAKLKASNEPDSFWSYYLRGEYDAAAGVVAESQEALRQHGLLYLAARSKKLDKLADQQWDLFLANLDGGDRDTRYVANWLRTGDAAKLDKLLNVRIMVDDKRIALLVAAAKYPAVATRCRELAKKLDFEGNIQSLCLKSINGGE